jgi:hypothetical protein
MPTILELFHSSGLRDSVKADTETLVEQELTGIRIKSAVEVNNPLIYGNEATRIAIRSTPSVEKMKDATGGTGGDGGLIGKGLGAITGGGFGKALFGGQVNSLSQARDGINSKLGIPGSPIPTFVDNHGDLQKGKEPDTMITLGKIRNDAAGTELGKFLKQTGGGNFRSIGRNVIGQGISLVKGKVRDTLFGSPLSVGENSPSNQSYEYSSQEPYSITIRNVKNSEPENDKLQLVQSQAKEKVDALKSKTKDLLKKNKKVDEVVEDNESSDEETYSLKNEQLKVKDSKETNLSIPTDESDNEVKKDTDAKLNESSPLDEEKKERVDYSKENKYSDVVKEEQTDDTSDGIFKRIDLSSLPGKVDKEPTLSSTIKELNSAFSSENLYSKDMPTLESLYGMGTSFDTLNADGKEGENFTRKELEDSDLIPIWIAAKGGKSVHFRSIISGLTETVTPSWSSQKFLGNPYNFYNYEGVERGISFNLKMFCYSKSELANMWTKIQFISKNCYPDFENVNKNKVIKPPIIEFRIGNIYKSKVSFIESLSYTIPDDSNWETIDGLQLPKIVEVAIGIKFIENAGIEDTLYAYEITEESLKIINEKRGANSESTSTFSEEPQTNGDGASPEVVKLDNTGVEITEETEKQKDNSGINKPPKDAKTGEASPEFDESITPKSKQQQRREKNRKDLLATGKIQEDATIFSTLVNVRKTIVAGRHFGFDYDTLRKENEEFISINYQNGNNVSRRVFSVISGKPGTTGVWYEKWKKDQAKKQEAPKENNSIETF